ncbi:MAG: hypothetical protein ACLFMX_07875 [Halobacteriales archaeon]
MARPRGSAVLAAVRSCLRADRSWLLRLYAPVGLLVALFAVILVVLALPTWVAEVHPGSATMMLGPGLLVIGGLAVAAGSMAPVIAAANRLPEANAALERGYGALGMAFLLGTYVGLIISTPPAYRSDLGGPLGVVVDWLYGLDPLLGVVPPAAAVSALVAYDRLVVA